MSTTTTKLRRALACLASIAIGVRVFLLLPTASPHVGERMFMDATVAMPFAAAALVWVDRLVAQLLARGAWWSILLLGTIVAMIGRRDASMGVYMASCSAAALLASGSTGLTSRGRFAPEAFRGTLLIALVLAIADTGAFAWYGIGFAAFEHNFWLLGFAGVMAIGVVGLVRLRTWGLLVNTVTNVAIIGALAMRVLPLESPLRELFIGSAAVQLVVPMPMLISIVRRRTPDPNAWRRTKAIAPIAIIVAIAAFSAVAAFAYHGRLIRY